MEKIKQSITANLATAKLFFNDLEQIDKILKDSGLSYTLIIDEYKLDSIEEIKSIEEKQDFNELRINLIQFNFRLIINEHGTHIYSDDDLRCIGIIEKIKPIINKRRRTLYYFSQFEWIFPVALSFLNPLLAIYYEDLYPDSIEYIISGSIILWSIKILLFKQHKNQHKNIVFTTKKSHEQNNYLTRNKDQLFTNSFSGLIGLVTGIFITLLRLKLTCK